MKSTMTFADFCRDFIRAHIYDHEGETIFFENLGYLITDAESTKNIVAEGFSDGELIDMLLKWREETGDFFEMETEEVGYVHNPFRHPAAFFESMVIEGVEYILKPVYDNFNNHMIYSITLDEETIKSIILDIDTTDKVF